MFNVKVKVKNIYEIYLIFELKDTYYVAIKIMGYIKN